MRSISTLVFLVFVAVWLYMFITRVVFTWFDHSYNTGALEEDATITNISSEKYQASKNGAKFKTTVQFSDGFTFVTFKTNREDHVMSYKISTDQNEIARLAMAAHEKAYQKSKI